MTDINSVTMTGNLTKDIEIRTGVFRPLPEEKNYVEVCRKETLSRGKNTFGRIKAYNTFLEDDVQPSLPVWEDCYE